MSDTDQNPDLNITYVHEGQEVRLTGRQAVKKLRNGRALYQYEITSVDPAFDMKKWVLFSDLYAVELMKRNK